MNTKLIFLVAIILLISLNGYTQDPTLSDTKELSGGNQIQTVWLEPTFQKIQSFGGWL
jgi:hypothetical protein